MNEADHLRRAPGLFDLKLDHPMFRRYRVVAHLLFWLSYFVYETLIWGMVDGEYGRRLTIAAIELPIKVAATYFTLYVLIDRLLMGSRYGLFLVSLLGSMIMFGVALRVLAYTVIYPMYYPDATAVPMFFLPKILISIFVIYSLVAIVASYHVIKHWYNHQQQSLQLQHTKEQLEKEKLQSELKLLKSQINPHFLFNTLNNLYALTLTQSKKAPEMVHKLSQLMTYMLYDSNQNEVPLDKEIRYLENYIALEKIRYDSRLDVSLNVYNDLEGINIAPLLILPFVENSFKHGVSNQLSKGWVRIDIALHENVLIVKVENSRPSGDLDKIIKPISGIGLQNVRKRLDLIYPDRYQLQLLDEEETFLVIFKLALTADQVVQKDLVHAKPITI